LSPDNATPGFERGNSPFGSVRPVGHNITALIIAEPYDERAASEWDVVAVPLGGCLRLVHINHYYTAYWQARRGGSAELDVPSEFPPVFPREGVVVSLAAALTRAGGNSRQPTFALVMTDYFGGVGDQWACAIVAGRRVSEVRDINGALRMFGIQRAAGIDEFDTVGLADHRRSPDYLDRYADLCDELGV
jgi:hypothetical protein